MAVLAKIIYLTAAVSFCAAQAGNGTQVVIATTESVASSEAPALTSTIPSSGSPASTSFGTPSATATAPASGGNLPYRPAYNISSVSFSGNGCPQGTQVGVKGDLITTLQITIPNFTAVSSSDFDPRKRSVNCQAHLNVEIAEQGWQFSPDVINHRGFAVLDSADTAVALYFTSYFSQDASNSDTSKVTISNPDDDRIAKIVDTSARSEVWSPCGTSALLNHNFRAALTSTDPTELAYFGPLVLLGRQTVAVQESITYKWRRC